MVTLYIVGILATIGLTGFITLKAVQYGLQWQVEVKNNTIPTMPNIISEQLEKKEQAQQEQIANTILNEYLNGGDPRA